MTTEEKFQSLKTAYINSAIAHTNAVTALNLNEYIIAEVEGELSLLKKSSVDDGANLNSFVTSEIAKRSEIRAKKNF